MFKFASVILPTLWYPDFNELIKKFVVTMLQLKVYSASNIRDELNVAMREFLQANVVVKKSSKVFLPKLVEKFSREASISLDDLLGWVMESVDKKLRDSIQKCLDRKSNKKPSQIIEWLPYSSKFRYIFSKDITDKPWWEWHLTALKRFF